jgi:cobalt-zinc-cadmium efflux system protein
MAADAAVSAGVVVAGLAIQLTGWLWLDPATSLVVVAIILVGTWQLLRSSVAMSLDRVPDSIRAHEVEDALLALPGVAMVHDLHIWPMSTTDVALTCHLIMPEGSHGDHFLTDAAEMLRSRFAIGHSTIQIERSEVIDCPQASPDVA